MSVYVVSVSEFCSNQSRNKTLCEIAQTFKGNIFHRDTNYGSLMVHEVEGQTPAQQLASIRSYFAERAMPVVELVNKTGHVIFEVDMTGLSPRNNPEILLELQYR